MRRISVEVPLLALLVATFVGCGWTAGEDSEGPPDARCLAAPTCDSGDRRVESCPDGGSCYTETSCGQTITCLRGGDDTGGSCDAYPTCDPGDLEVSQCPDTGQCYNRTRCESTILCLRRASDASDTGPEPDTGDTGPVPDTNDTGTDLDADGGSCPPPSSSNPDTSCLQVSVCCYNESTGELCRYATPCVAPNDLESEWACGPALCSRDTGG